MWFFSTKVVWYRAINTEPKNNKFLLGKPSLTKFDDEHWKKVIPDLIFWGAYFPMLVVKT